MERSGESSGSGEGRLSSSSDFYCDDDDLVCDRMQLQFSTDDRRLRAAFESLQALRANNAAIFMPDLNALRQQQQQQHQQAAGGTVRPLSAAVMQESDMSMSISDGAADDRMMMMICSDPCVYGGTSSRRAYGGGGTGGGASDGEEEEEDGGEFMSASEAMCKSSSTDPYVEPRLFSPPPFDELRPRNARAYLVEPSGSWTSAAGGGDSGGQGGMGKRAEELVTGNWLQSKGHYRLTFSQSSAADDGGGLLSNSRDDGQQRLPHGLLATALMAQQKRRDSGADKMAAPPSLATMDKLGLLPATAATATTFSPLSIVHRAATDESMSIDSNSNCTSNVALKGTMTTDDDSRLILGGGSSKAFPPARLTSWKTVRLERQQLAIVAGCELRKSASQPENVSRCLDSDDDACDGLDTVSLRNVMSTLPDSQAVSLLSLYRRSKSLPRNSSGESGDHSKPDRGRLLETWSASTADDYANCVRNVMNDNEDEDDDASYVNLKERPVVGAPRCERCMERGRGATVSVQTSLLIGRCMSTDDKSMQTSASCSREATSSASPVWRRVAHGSSMPDIAHRSSAGAAAASHRLSMPVLPRSSHFYTNQTLPDLGFLRSSSAVAISRQHHRATGELCEKDNVPPSTVARSTRQAPEKPPRSRSLESGFSDCSGGYSTPPDKRAEHRGSNGDVGYASQSTGSDGDSSSASSGGKAGGGEKCASSGSSSSSKKDNCTAARCDVGSHDKKIMTVGGDEEVETPTSDVCQISPLNQQTTDYNNERSAKVDAPKQSDSCHSLPAQADGDDICQPLRPCLVKRRLRTRGAAGEQGIRALKHRSWSDPYDVQQLHHQCYLGCMKLLTDLSAISAKLAALQVFIILSVSRACWCMLLENVNLYQASITRSRFLHVPMRFCVKLISNECLQLLLISLSYVLLKCTKLSPKIMLV
jgi:hypothetical protein